MLTYGQVIRRTAGSFLAGAGRSGGVAVPPGHTDLIGYTLTEIDPTLSNLSVGTPQPYLGGGTTFRFSVTENITLQGDLGAPPAVPEPGTLALSLVGTPLLLIGLIRRLRHAPRA